MGEAFNAPVARALDKDWSKDRIVALVGKIIDDANGRKTKGEVNTKSLAIIFTCQSAKDSSHIAFCILYVPYQFVLFFVLDRRRRRRRLPR